MPSNRLRLRIPLPLLAVAVVLAGVPAAAEPPPLEHDPEAVRRLADEILARDEFRPPEATLLERIFQWIADHLIPGDSEAGSGSGATTTAGAGGSSVVTVVLIVLAVAGLGYALWILVRQPRRRRPDDDDEPAVEIEAYRTAGDWRDAAAEHEGAGRWKEGLRCRFRALVESLIDAGAVPEIPGRTSGELRLDVADSLPDVAADFAAAADLFDRAWYGDLPTGPDEARRFAGHADRVSAGAAAAAHRPAAEPVEELV